MRELTRRELQAETEDDIMVMVADSRATILAGFVAGTAVSAGFIAAVVLVTGLWGVLQAFRFGMLVGLTGFVVLAAIVGLLSFFIPRFPTTRAVAGILVLTVAVIISVSVFVSDVAILPMAGRLLLNAVGGAVLLVVRLWVPGAARGRLRRSDGPLTATRAATWRTLGSPVRTSRHDPHGPARPVGGFQRAAPAGGHVWRCLLPDPLACGRCFLFAFLGAVRIPIRAGLGAPSCARCLMREWGRSSGFGRASRLGRLLQSEDALLLGAVFQSVIVDPATGVARIRGTSGMRPRYSGFRKSPSEYAA